MIFGDKKTGIFSQSDQARFPFMGTFPFLKSSYHFSRLRVQESDGGREPWR